MNQLNAFEKFEHEVRTVVRRGSKSSEFESPIKEIGAHFGDLVDEGIRSGISQAESELLAKKRLGGPVAIALQILRCPSRILRGTRIQQATCGIPLAITVLFVVASYFTGWMSEKKILFICASWAIFILSALAFGFGLQLAKKIIWKPFAVCGIIGAIFAASVLYQEYSKVRLLDGMTKAEVKQRVDKFESQISHMSNERFQLEHILVATNRPVETRLEAINNVIATSKSDIFVVDPNSTGKYLTPVEMRKTNDKVATYKLFLTRTSSARIADREWQNLHASFAGFDENRNESQKWRYFAESEAMPTYLIIAGGIELSMAFSGVFLCLASIGFVTSRIWIMRKSWLQLSQGY